MDGVAPFAPSGIGLPYDSWRPGQWPIVSGICESELPHHLLVAPTGFGKSLSYMAIAALTGLRTVILTSTKALQDQLTRDFRAIGMEDVRGRSNYPCHGHTIPGLELLTRKGWTCQHAPCQSGVFCPLKDEGCDYYDQIRRAEAVDIVATNYAFWMHQRREPKLGDRQLIIMDEAHLAPQELADFFSFRLAPEVKRVFRGRMPEGEDLGVWQEWSRWAATEMKGRLKGAGPHTPAESELAHTLDRMARMLGRGEWVVERLGTGREAGTYAFDCTRPADFGKAQLWGGAEKVVLVSATVNPMPAAQIGMDPKEVKQWEAKSVFDPARRPVYAIDGAPQLNFRMVEGQKRMWAGMIDRILSSRKERKGIIHTTSFDRARYLIEKSAHSSRMLLNESGTTRDTVAVFKHSKPGTILVSPSVTTGYDFPYDECLWQVIAKIPFPDMRTKAAKVVAAANPDWAGYQAAQAMVQASGRGMRAADDLCETFIPDGNFGWWWNRNRKFTPRWFQDGVRWAAAGKLPEPLAMDKLRRQ